MSFFSCSMNRMAYLRLSYRFKVTNGLFYLGAVWGLRFFWLLKQRAAKGRHRSHTSSQSGHVVLYDLSVVHSKVNRRVMHLLFNTTQPFVFVLCSFTKNTQAEIKVITCLLAKYLLKYLTDLNKALPK